MVEVDEEKKKLYLGFVKMNAFAELLHYLPLHVDQPHLVGM